MLLDIQSLFSIFHKIFPNDGYNACELLSMNHQQFNFIRLFSRILHDFWDGDKKLPAVVSSCGFYFVFTLTEKIHVKLYIIDVSHESRDKRMYTEKQRELILNFLISGFPVIATRILFVAEFNLCS